MFASRLAPSVNYSKTPPSAEEASGREASLPLRHYSTVLKISFFIWQPPGLHKPFSRTACVLREVQWIRKTGLNQAYRCDTGTSLSVRSLSRSLHTSCFRGSLWGIVMGLTARRPPWIPSHTAAFSTLHKSICEPIE